MWNFNDGDYIQKKFNVEFYIQNNIPWPASVKSITTLKKENSHVQSPSPAARLVAHPESCSSTN